MVGKYLALYDTKNSYSRAMGNIKTHTAPHAKGPNNTSSVKMKSGMRP